MAEVQLAQATPYSAAITLSSDAEAINRKMESIRRLARTEQIIPAQFTQGDKLLNIPKMSFMYGKRVPKRPKKPKVVKVFCTKNMYGVIVSRDETDALYQIGAGLAAEDLAAFGA
jgi:hypothetical protein